MTRRGEAPLLLLIIRGGCYPAGFSSPFRPRATHLATTPGAPQPPVTQTYRRLIRLVGPQKLYPITFLHGVRVIHPTLPSKNFRLGPRIYHRRDIFPRAVLPLKLLSMIFHRPSFLFSFFLSFFFFVERCLLRFFFFSLVVDRRELARRSRWKFSNESKCD